MDSNTENRMDDKQLHQQIATDLFHQGAESHAQFEGFSQDRRVDPCEVQGMSDREIAEAAARVSQS